MRSVSRILSLALCLCMLLGVLSGCAKKLDGKYSAEAVLNSSLSYIFSGSDVKLTLTALGNVVTSLEGTYEINEEEGTITFTFGDKNDDSEEAKKYTGTQTFEEGEDFIKIAGVTYKQVK